MKIFVYDCNGGVMTKKIIIIGGGIAGVSAGVYACLSGYEVDIYEKNSIIGGECTGWNRKGLHIDNCIHWLTGTRKDTELYEVWCKVGALSEDTEYVNGDAFYSSVSNGVKVTLWSDLERTKTELLTISPEDRDEIEKFIRYVEYSKQCLFPANKPMDLWTIKDYIKIGMAMKDFGPISKEFRKVSLEEYAGRFKHPAIQKLMCDYLPNEYCAYSFFVSYATGVDGNGNIPMGASLQMSLRMANRCKELGGNIHVDQIVKSINVEKGKVVGITLGDNTRVKADYVISAVDTHTLFNKLIDNRYLPKSLKRAYESPEKYPTISGFQVAFGIPFDGRKQDETVFIDIEPLKAGNTFIDRMYVKIYGYDEIYIKDGKCVMQTCLTQSDADYEYWKSLPKRDYEENKKNLVAEIMKRICNQFPAYEDNIEYLDAWTPLTYERYCNAYHGSYMSFITTPQGKQIQLNGRIKGIKNLYLAGQWVNSPGGLPVAVSSGKFAVQRILKSEKRDISI